MTNANSTCYMEFDWLGENVHAANQISCNINISGFDLNVRKIFYHFFVVAFLKSRKGHDSKN